MSDRSHIREQAEGTVAGAFRGAWRAVVRTWLVVVLAGFAVAAFRSIVPSGSSLLAAFTGLDGLVVAVLSLLVAAVSMLPGFLLGRSLKSASSGAVSAAAERVSQRVYEAVLAGILIRLIGTVALFLTCRYQLASTAEVVAALSIGWYVLLTLVEVVAVSRQLPRSLSRDGSGGVGLKLGVSSSHARSRDPRHMSSDRDALMIAGPFCGLALETWERQVW